MAFKCRKTGAMLWAILAILFPTGAMFATGAAAEEISLEVRGEGMSRQDAIVAGLASAVEQVSGVKIESASSLRVELRSVANATEDANSLAEEQQREISRQSGGFVKRYAITGEENNSTYLVTLNVVVERFSAPGLPTQDRRRIVVANPLDLSGKAGDNAALLRERLTSFLVQSRRFAVLDRNNDPVFKRELDLLRGPDVPMQETLRIGQTLGADYIVLVKIRAHETQTQSQTVRLTGRTVATQTSLISVDFSIFDVATRQVKWTGRFGDAQNAGISETLDIVATALGENILDAIYPMQVLQAGADGSIVINQGGETLRVGQALSLNRLGDEMIDPYTKEPLGRAEMPIGRIVIERVDPKMSYGRLISGQAIAGENGFVLRKLAADPAPAAQQAAPQATGSKPRW